MLDYITRFKAARGVVFAFLLVASNRVIAADQGSADTGAIDEALKAQEVASKPVDKATGAPISKDVDIVSHEQSPTVPAVPVPPAPLANAEVKTSDPCPPEQMMPNPLVFEKAPLGNVIRILSARLGATIRVEGKAEGSVTGDFGHMDLKKALIAAADQTGLVVVVSGTEELPEYSLVRCGSVVAATREQDGSVKANTADAGGRDPKIVDAKLAEIAKKRALLLKLRDSLEQEQAAAKK